MAQPEINSLVSVSQFNNLIEQYAVQDAAIAAQEKTIVAAIQEIRALQSALNAAAEQRSDLIQRSNAFKTTHQSEVAALKSSNQKLVETFDQHKKKLAVKEFELAALKAQLLGVQTLLQERDQIIAKLLRQSTALRNEVVQLNNAFNETKKVFEAKEHAFSKTFFNRVSEGFKEWLNEGEGHLAVGFLTTTTAAGAHGWPTAPRLFFGILGVSIFMYSAEVKKKYHEKSHYEGQVT